MERITLTQNSKNILKGIKNETYQFKDSDSEDVNLLYTLELIDISYTKDGAYIDGLTERGRAYLHVNPKLKNPSIWEDKKYWINTAISILALAVAIIALFR